MVNHPTRRRSSHTYLDMIDGVRKTSDGRPYYWSDRHRLGWYAGVAGRPRDSRLTGDAAYEEGYADGVRSRSALPV